MAAAAAAAAAASAPAPTQISVVAYKVNIPQRKQTMFVLTADALNGALFKAAVYPTKQAALTQLVTVCGFQEDDVRFHEISNAATTIKQWSIERKTPSKKMAAPNRAY